MIRPFAGDDGDAVLAVWLAASLQAHDFIHAAYWHARCADMREHYLPLAENIVFADDADGTVLGFMSCIDSFLAGLFVRPDAQGRGIGRRLLDLMLRMHPDADLTVYAQNHRAVRFYARAGFVVRAVRREAATGCKEYGMLYNPALAQRVRTARNAGRRKGDAAVSAAWRPA